MQRALTWWGLIWLHPLPPRRISRWLRVVQSPGRLQAIQHGALVAQLRRSGRLLWIDQGLGQGQNLL